MIRGQRSRGADLEAALRGPAQAGRLAVVPYLTAGYPDMARFPAKLARVAAVSDAIEIGFPFSAPVADGVTIQRSSHTAIRHGVTLRRTLDCVRAISGECDTPVTLMSYFNPLLAFGIGEFAAAAADAGVAGLVVPDLPVEECGPLFAALESAGLALVQIITPRTPGARLRRLCAVSRGFVYAVTLTGTTGGDVEMSQDLAAYLDRVRAMSPLPVLAGFGIRVPPQVEALRGHVDGVIVGSAMVELIERGDDAVAFVRALIEAGSTAGRRT